MQALSVWTGDRVRHYRVFQDEVCGSSLSSNFFSLFLCKFLIVWQFGCTIHSEPLTSLCVVFILQKGYALDPDGVRCKTIEKLIKHFYDFPLPRCDVKLTAPYK